MKRKKRNFKSECCNAEVHLSKTLNKLFGNFSEKISTGTYECICSKCHKACDVYIPIRKVWTINPKTRIIPNKKKRILDKLSQKEINKYRKNEDF